jgi:hypothetical protein
MNEPKPKEKKDFLFSLKIKTAIIGAILYFCLSSNVAFKILNLILSAIFNNHNNLDIITEKNEPSVFARFIMSFIILLILFIF